MLLGASYALGFEASTENTCDLEIQSPGLNPKL